MPGSIAHLGLWGNARAGGCGFGGQDVLLFLFAVLVFFDKEALAAEGVALGQEHDG